MTAESAWQRKLKMAASTDVVDVTAVDGDADDRFTRDAAGKMEWGNGTDAVDTVLQRTGAAALGLTGALTASGLLSGAGLVLGDYTLKIHEVAFGATELGGTETNTSFTFVAGSILLYAFINVADGESGTMDVGTQGTSNDPDGILDGIDLTNTGVVMPGITVTGGLNIDFIGAATTVGALWYKKAVGTDAVADAGYAFYLPQVIAAADPVSITSSGDLNSCSGSLYLVVLEPSA